MSNQTINCILKDSRGFMWFGTANGLNLYDGYTIQNYYYDPDDSLTISNNIINCLYEDSKGRIWIGTMGGGLNLYNPNNQSFYAYMHNPGNPASITADNVFSILEDKDGFLWIGTGSGLNKFIEKENRFVRYVNDVYSQNSLSYDYITDLEFDHEGLLWVATFGGGISIMNIYTNQFTNIKKGENSINDNEIWDIHMGSDGLVWIGTANGGINFYNPKDKKFRSFTKLPKEFNYLFNTNVVSIKEDSEGNIWFATDRGGLYNFEGNMVISHMNDPTRDESLASNALTKICFTKDDILWVGTYDKGVEKTNLNQMKFVHVRNEYQNSNSLSDNNVNAIFEDQDGVVWIGTEKGLNKTDKEFTDFEHFLVTDTNKYNPFDNVNLTIISPQKDEIWFGGYTGGINIYNKRNKTFKWYIHNDVDSTSLTSNFVRSLYQDKQGDIWIGTVRGGLDKFIPEKEEFMHFPYTWEQTKYLNSTNVMDLLDDGKNLYIATYGGGLNVYNYKNETFKYFTHSDKDQNSISDDLVITLFIDSKGQLWVGTNHGLNLFDPVNKSFKRFYKKDGLANNVILSIEEDDFENLWISTNDGLSKLNMQTYSFTNFYKEDGLQDNTFIYNSSCKFSNGELAFGGVNGLTVFNPDLVYSPREMPKTYFTKLKVLNQEVTMATGKNSILTEPIYSAKEIRLNHNHKLFAIEFSTLTYYSSRKINFAYKLGEDEKWINLGETNLVSFHNLNPGSYTLYVRSLNNDGRIFGPISSIHITITPPYYKNWWFYLILGFTLLVMFLGYYYYKISNVKKQKAKLQKLVFEKTLELQNANQMLQDHRSELMMQNEEISSQRDLAEMQKNKIEKQHNELELHRNHLEKLIVERTKDLIQAKERAEESDRLKTAFLANMSHEIRTPMNAIIGFIQLLDEEENTQEERAMFKKLINESGAKLLALINDLIDLAKIEANQLTLNIQAISMAELYRSLKKFYANHPVLGDNNIILTFDNPEENLFVQADSFRMNQVLTNLLDNALKFTENGKVHCGISEEEGSITCYVKDEGVGIRSGDLENIFERFRKGEENTNKLYRGTGLGLAMCKELVSLMKGEIWADSELGKGSVFYVKFFRK